ncbi:LCP family protein [Halobacillus yeomjeoni]|uniref:LCP family glycopolymer transferase n=1 Tax=Halobacillus yeomjeoni TaxID=311194 RepID=UPI001CD4C680|nr:LCP family protein [Halobacillus yeomjeoni]MCA0984733.1 LCP family protein [Halobacillus yeomjeoni]
MSRALRKKKKSWWWKLPLLLVALVVGAGAVYTYTIYSGAKETVDARMHKEVASIDHVVTKKKLKNKEPLNILLLGVDERQNDRGRSDALMVLSLDPDNDRSQLVSIPRDTRTEMVGDSSQAGKLDKINHAYAFGGADMAISTVENFLDIELDYYVKVNMEGLADLVDAVGGITIDNPISWTEGNGETFAKGSLTMDGDKALRYVRMRYQDPKGDLGRNERQRLVIKGVIDSGAQVGAVNKIGDVMDALGHNVTTNMDFGTMKDLVLNYRTAQKNMTTYQMTGSGTKIGGIYYLQVSDSEIHNVQQMIKEYNS